MSLEDGNAAVNSTNSTESNGTMKPVNILGWSEHFNTKYLLVEYDQQMDGMNVAKLVPAKQFMEEHPDLFVRNIC